MSTGKTRRVNRSDLLYLVMIAVSIAFTSIALSLAVIVLKLGK